MTVSIRRKIPELITLFEIEPGLTELIVEGTSDKNFFGWFFDGALDQSVNITTIDDIEIDSSLLDKHGLKGGNRSRAIALAIELDNNLDTEQCARYAVVADADFDYVLGSFIETKSLFYTDYTSIELYAFSDVVLNKLFRMLASGLYESRTQIKLDLETALQEIFRFRIANEQIGWGMAWMTPTRVCACKNNSLKFDSDEFLKRYLAKNGMFGRKEEFLQLYQHCEAYMKNDSRKQIHGHDFLELLTHALVKHVRPKNLSGNVEAIGKILMSSLEKDLLKDEDLFRSLETHLCRQSE